MFNQNKYLVCILVMIVLTGCTHKDPIDRVVNEESKNPFFGNGIFRPISLPTNAPIGEVVTQVFESPATLPIPVAGMNIVTQRQVNIFGETYTAVLVRTLHEQKVVLLQYSPYANGWWSCIYDSTE